MGKLDQVKRAGLLAGLILAISIILIGLNSYSSAQSRFAAVPLRQNSFLPGDQMVNPIVRDGAELSVSMDTRVNGAPSSSNGILPGIVSGLGKTSRAARQPRQSVVEREVCIANTGKRETRGLAIQDLIEEEETPGVFIPLPGMQIVVPVSRELQPHERWCQVAQISFLPISGVRHRLTTTVSITNHVDFLPGTPECPSVQGCSYEKVVSTFLEIPAMEVLLLPLVFSSVPTLQPSAAPTPNTQAVIIGVVDSPLEDSPDPAPPPEPATSSQPHDTTGPQPTQTPVNSDPTQNPDPTKPPEYDDEEEGDEEDNDRGHDDHRGEDDDDGDDDDDD